MADDSRQRDRAQMGACDGRLARMWELQDQACWWRDKGRLRSLEGRHPLGGIKCCGRRR